jgi:hypothetical protein
MTENKIKEYNEILEYLDAEIKQLENVMIQNIKGLKYLELNEKGEIVSFVAECKAKDFQRNKNHSSSR